MSLFSCLYFIIFFHLLMENHNDDNFSLFIVWKLCGKIGSSSETYRGIAQSGSALALGASGRKFESYYPDHCAPVAQLDRATVF